MADPLSLLTIAPPEDYPIIAISPTSSVLNTNTDEVCWDQLTYNPAGAAGLLETASVIDAQATPTDCPYGYNLSAVGTCIHGIAEGETLSVKSNAKINLLDMVLISLGSSSPPSGKIYMGYLPNAPLGDGTNGPAHMIAQNNPNAVYIVPVGPIHALHRIIVPHQTAKHFLTPALKFAHQIDKDIGLGSSCDAINRNWRPWHRIVVSNNQQETTI